jgi:serine-type D-Ala-D-Ala carboxypeptidase/endopeptidase (penicillin-binding protein 4)
MAMTRPAVLLATLVALIGAPAAHAAGLAATQRVLAQQMAHAGGASGAYVTDLGSGEVIYAARADTPRMPASVEKLYTSSTALLRFGAAGHLTTSVLAADLPDAAGAISGDVVLRGAGDPTFGPSAMSQLAARIAQGGVKRIDGRVVGDESAFDAFRGPPSANLQLSSDVGPLSALAYNEGRTGRRSPYFQASPATFVAQAFERALRHAHVKVTGSARAGLASTGMTPLSYWDSPSLADITRDMNQPSDNYMAETLAKDLGAHFGTAGSTAAGAAVVRDTVRRFSIAPTVVDGSGLSRFDRTTPRQIVGLLTGMEDSDVVAPFIASLPVAGRSGTLSTRMRGTAAQDRCHAKTGTLHDVSTLAGYCDSAGGDRIAFAFLMNRVHPAGAHVLQDKMTVALARYEAEH